LIDGASLAHKKSRREGSASLLQGLIGPGETGEQIVAGAVQRKGNVIARVIDRVDTDTLSAFVRETVSTKVSLISTDEHSGYRHLSREFLHGIVRHSTGEYIAGAVHTNTIEGF
jgi:hypothetical protein